MQGFTQGIHKFSPSLLGWWEVLKLLEDSSSEGPLYQTLDHSFPNDPFFLTSCCHLSLFLAPGNWGEQRGERKVLKVESDPCKQEKKRESEVDPKTSSLITSPIISTTFWFIMR